MSNEFSEVAVIHETRTDRLRQTGQLTLVVLATVVFAELTKLDTLGQSMENNVNKHTVLFEICRNITFDQQ